MCCDFFCFFVMIRRPPRYTLTDTRFPDTRLFRSVAMDLQGSTSLDEEVAALSRGADRDSLFMQAALTIAGQATPLMVRVRNLSAGGMLAETTETRVCVEPSAAVEIDLHNRSEEHTSETQSLMRNSNAVFCVK